MGITAQGQGYQAHHLRGARPTEKARCCRVDALMVEFSCLLHTLHHFVLLSSLYFFTSVGHACMSPNILSSQKCHYYACNLRQKNA